MEFQQLQNSQREKTIQVHILPVGLAEKPRDARRRAAQAIDSTQNRRAVMHLDHPVEGSEAVSGENASSGVAASSLVEEGDEDTTTGATEMATSSADGRQSNRGSSKRQGFSYSRKAEMIHELELWQTENPRCPISQYISERGLNKGRFKKYFSKGKGGWLEEDTKNRIMMMAAEAKYKHLKRPTRFDSAKYKDMELQLFKTILQRRNRKARVSVNFIKCTAKTLMKELHPDVEFKASQGWFHAFKRRRKLKYRKRQNKKKVDVETKRDEVSDDMYHCECVRTLFLTLQNTLHRLLNST